MKYTLIVWIVSIIALKTNNQYELISLPSDLELQAKTVVDHWWFWLALLPPLNLWLSLVLGRYLLAMTLFPYQNACMRETMDRTNALKFG